MNNQTTAKRKAPIRDNIRNTQLRNLPLNAVTHFTKIINAAFRFTTSLKQGRKLMQCPKQKQYMPLYPMDKVFRKTLFRQNYPSLSS
jgi:hypothetical protein